ncbi:MAG TPA: hypothetical protein VFL90_01440 [Methylomirabilota bacterium]|nr:hypothetical protein [Methylomirabilota bacterium]
MATLVGVFTTSHSPTTYQPAERWNEVRASRRLRADVPFDDLEANRAKKARVERGFATLREKLIAATPEAIVIFGDDQLECFDFTNFPAFAVYVGESFEGPRIGRVARARIPGHPALGTALVTGLMRRGFDPAFSLDMPRPERGVGHAFVWPTESLTDFTTPVVPIFINCYYAPQPTALRCYELGRAVREIIDGELPGLRVAVVGSGGLWHTPNAPDAYLDEAFDRAMLGFLAAGDARGMARYFDGYEVPAGDRSQDVGARGTTATGLPGPGGPQGGTRETCNWIAAAAVADGKPAVVVDYVPVYASPIGAAFAYWPSV